MLQYGRICVSQSSQNLLQIEGIEEAAKAGSSAGSSPRNTTDLSNGHELMEVDGVLHISEGAHKLVGHVPREVQEAFTTLLREAVLDKRLY